VTNELEALELEAQTDSEAPSAQYLPHPLPTGNFYTGDFQNGTNGQDTLVDTEDFSEPEQEPQEFQSQNIEYPNLSPDATEVSRSRQRREVKPTLKAIENQKWDEV